MKLLYRTAEWHAFAKMQLHTETTLKHLEDLTTELGKLMRDFEHFTCSKFQTFELPREVEARKWREDARRLGSDSVSASNTGGIRKKTLNLFTYKWHALADYVPSIRLFGGVDGFSSQLVSGLNFVIFKLTELYSAQGELCHRLVKQLYKLTNKRNAAKQIGSRVRRLERAQAAFHRRRLREKRYGLQSNKHCISKELERDDRQNNDSDLRYFISTSQNEWFDIIVFLKSRIADPVYKVSVLYSILWPVLIYILQGFLPKLQDHLLGRLLGRDFDGDTHDSFTPADRQSVRILAGRIYSVNTCQVFYTTYDVQRQTDTINPRSCPDIMVYAPPDDDNSHYERYWYARVLGIYHAKIICSHPDVVGGNEVCRMEFLWVRWFGAEPGYTHGFRRAKLPKIGFMPSSDEYAFGFLDPRHVIRSCYLIPAFSCGRTTKLLPVAKTDARCLRYGQSQPDSDDWTNYYVNMWV